MVQNENVSTQNYFPFSECDTHKLQSMNENFSSFSHRKMQREFRKKSKAASRIKNNTKLSSGHRMKNTINKLTEWRNRRRCGREIDKNIREYSGKSWRGYRRKKAGAYTKVGGFVLDL